MSFESVSFQFKGRKLLFDLATKVKSTPGTDVEEFSKALELLVLGLTLVARSKNDDDGDGTKEEFEELTANTKKDLTTHFIESVKKVRFLPHKEKLERWFAFVLKFIFDQSTLDTLRDVASTIYVDGIGPKLEGEEKEKGGEKKTKRKREKDKKKEGGEEKSHRHKKKLRKEQEDEKAGRELETVVSLIPEDVWNEIFLLLPNMWDVMTLTMVNTAWLKLVKTIIATNFPFLIKRSDELMQSFANQKDVITGSLDLDYDDEISGLTLSKFDRLTELSLEGNFTIDGDSLGLLTSLRTLKGADMLTDNILMNLVNLTHLNLTNACVVSGTSFKKLSSLLRFEMEDPKHRHHILNNLGELINLTHLTDTGTGDYNVPPTISKLTALISLECGRSWNSGTVRNLTNLTYLKMNDECMIDDDGLKRLINLTHLDISYYYGEGDEGPPTDITDRSVSKLTKLKTLIMFGRHLVSGNVFGRYVPPQNGRDEVFFQNMKELSRLDVRHSDIAIDDDQLETLTSLTYLNVSGSTTIQGRCFEAIGENLLTLKIADLYYDDTIFGHLQNLTSLTVSHKDVEFSAIATLTRLTKLKIIEEEPEGYFRYVGPFFDENQLHLWSGLVNLKTLVLQASEEESERTFISSDLVNAVLLTIGGQLKRVKIFDSHSLTDEAISSLTSCTELNVVRCGLVTPKSLCKLEKLKHLLWVQTKKYDENFPYPYNRLDYLSYLPLLKLYNLKSLKVPHFYAYSSRKTMGERYRLATGLLKLNGISKNQLAPITKPQFS